MSQKTKDKIINEIIRIEGGYVNNPNDRGGETKYGITIQVQRENGYLGKMKDLPREVAYNIYQKRYWDVNRLSDIQNLSEKIQYEVQDTGVNMGVSQQARILQRALNSLNLNGKIFQDLVEDGIIGRLTIEALHKHLTYGNQYRVKNQELVLLRVLNQLQGARYVEIQEGRKANKDFVFGWFLDRVQI